MLANGHRALRHEDLVFAQGVARVVGLSALFEGCDGIWGRGVPEPEFLAVLVGKDFVGMVGHGGKG